MTESSPPALPSPGSDESTGAGRLQTNTWPMWVIALLPLAGLLTGAVGFGVPLSARSAAAPGLTITVAFVPLIIELVLAAADRRILAARGVVAPLHWGWAVFDPIYVIGRSVVVRRRGRGSLAPLWVWLGATALVLVVNLLRR